MNNNWEEEVKSVPRYLGCNELELASEMNQILIAELESIKGEIENSIAEPTELEDVRIYNIALKDTISILDSHINKLIN